MIFASACSTAAAQSGGTVGLVHVAAMLSAVLMFGVIGCGGVMGIMYLILLARLSRALGTEAKLAEQAVHGVL
jgi:ammonia channel protein AmtB